MNPLPPSTASRRIVLADDHELFRQGLRALLSTQNEFTIVGQTRCNDEALSEVLNLRPDILVTDIAASGDRGPMLIDQLKRRLPALRIVVLTLAASQETLRQMLTKGVEGFLLKDTSLSELLAALRCVAEGRRYLSPNVSGSLVDSWLSSAGARREDSPLSALTARERSILQLIAEGGSNRSVAEHLSVSMKTVEKHRANLMRKLGLRNAGELLMVAVETGLIEKPGTVSRLVPVRMA